MKTYKYLQTTPTETDVKQRTIVESEIVYVKDDADEYIEKETQETKFTIAQLELEIANIDTQIASLEDRKTELQTKITDAQSKLSTE